MTTIESLQLSTTPARPQVRRIHEGELRWALAEGWKDFRMKRGDVLILALVYPLVGFVAAALTFNARLLPMLFPLVAGLTILGPAVASGYYEIARRREAGLESSWVHFLDPLRGRSFAPLALLTAGLAVLFFGWLLAAWAIYAATIGAEPLASRSDFLRALFTTPEGWTMIALGNLVGFGFAVATLVLALVSFPMVVDKPVGAGVAIATSVRAAMANPRVTALWGLRVAGLLALGCLPAFVGLAIVLPVLGYATWHLYTRLVDR
jgi:uncharacterized membrane protein